MKDKKSILVLLSTYNGEKYVSAQIDSIINQKSIHTVDLLIRDDGSKDTTVELLEDYRNKYPHRITIIKGNNIGYIRSFFELIKCAKGYDYYSLADQDDVWLENKLDIAIEWMEKYKDDRPLLYGASSYLVYDDLKPFGLTQTARKEITFFNTIIQNFFPGHEQVMNRALLNELKKEIDYSKVYVHDSWITNVAIIKGKVIFNNSPFVYYRQHQSNEIGFGKGKVGWIKERIRRVRNNDNVKYATQIKYFYEIYGSDLKLEYKKEMERFFKCNKNFIKRLWYVFNSKLYRQSSKETFMFKLLYLFGGYR